MKVLTTALLVALAAAPLPAQAKKLYRVRHARGGHAYARTIDLTIGPFPIEARQDREVCQYVELPYAKMRPSCAPGDRPGDPERCGLTIVGYDIQMKGTGASHHFILWSYEGTSEAAAKFPSGIHDSKACIDFGPADSVNTRQIGGSQSRTLKTILPGGLGQQIGAFHDADGTPRGIGLILNSHYVAMGTPTTGLVKLRLYLARPRAVKAYAKLIFDPVAGAFIDVPPGQVRTTSFSWQVGGLSVPIFGGPPQNDACVLFISGHMHKRGVRFTTELIDETGVHPIYESHDYSDMGQKPFRPPQLMTRARSFRYECEHDNGVTTPQKMGCELEPGVTPGTAQVNLLASGRLDGSAHGCATDADCAGIGTGRCVPANLVFGFTGDDDMCILPGLYFDAIPDAPPGRECDLSLLGVSS